MPDNFKNIRRLYSDSFLQHGDSPASLLTPKGRNELRFSAIKPFVIEPGTRVLDYGCGLGYLYEYLQKSGCEFSYTGVDMLPEFVNACSQKFPDADFRNVEEDGDVIGEFDVVFASGVFNICTHNDPVESRAYALARVEQLFGWAKEVLVCDFLSSYVDFQQSDAQHFSVGEIADFSVTRLGRRFLIRHDVLPYEMTLVAWSNSTITRPENFYEVDK